MPDTEGNACGLVWANKMLQTADAHAAGLAALQPGPCRINVQGYAAIQNGLCAGLYCGSVCMEVQEG